MSGGLCKNRRDPLTGTNTSTISNPRCALDAIVLFLPLVALLPILFLRLLPIPTPSTHSDPPILRWTYRFFLLANLLMQLLELVRLALAKEGIALLPAVLVLLLAILALDLARYSSKFFIPLYLYLALAEAFKLGFAVAVMNAGYKDVSKYPTSDQVTDVAVLLGIYLILAALLSARLRKWTRALTDSTRSKVDHLPVVQAKWP